MLSTEDAIKFMDNYTAIVVRGSAMTASTDDIKAFAEANDGLIALLTGSSRIDRKAATLDTETQLCEAIDPKKIERDRLLTAGFQNLFDELVVGRQRMHEALVQALGCQPQHLVLRARDLLHMVVDLGAFMVAMGSPWSDVVTKIEADEKERRERTKFATRSMEDEAKPILKAKNAAPEAEVAPEAAKG